MTGNAYEIIYIMLAGALGAVSRYLLSFVFNKYNALLVNIIGCFIVGLLIGTFNYLLEPVAPAVKIISFGFLGAFTTFSAFSLENIELWQDNKALAAGYFITTTIGCLLALMAGIIITRS